MLHVVLLAAASWSPQAPLVDRRALLRGAAAFAVPALVTPLGASAIVSDLGKSGLSKEEFYQALADRKEAERVAALPINQLKAMRERYGTASALVDSGDWSTLRDVISETTGAKLRDVQKQGKFTGKACLEATSKLRKLMFQVDTFAYSQQDFPGADLFSGYCADGVVPRESGGCKLKPKADRATVIAQLKEGAALYDTIVATAQ